MKITILSGLDINGQANLLSKWINTNTAHKSTNVICGETYLKYPYDAKVSAIPVPAGTVIPGEDFAPYLDADFFIFRWIDPKFVYDLARAGRVNATNTIIRLHGSEVRMYPFIYAGLWQHLGLTMVSNGYDYYLNKDLGYVHTHIPPMIDCKKLWDIQTSTPLPSEKMIIGHAPTDPAKKGTKYLEQATKDLEGVETRIITGKSWEETIKSKASCHIIFDQISQELGIGTFGVNLLEALAQSKIVLGDVNYFTYSVYPELEQAVINVTKDNLRDTIIRLRDSDLWQARYKLNDPGLDFVRTHFDVSVVCRQWINLMLFLSQGS